jgi:hypothetical protein
VRGGLNLNQVRNKTLTFPLTQKEAVKERGRRRLIRNENEL